MSTPWWLYDWWYFHCRDWRFGTLETLLNSQYKEMTHRLLNMTCSTLLKRGRQRERERERQGHVLTVLIAMKTWIHLKRGEFLVLQYGIKHLDKTTLGTCRSNLTSSLDKEVTVSYCLLTWQTLWNSSQLSIYRQSPRTLNPSAIPQQCLEEPHPTVFPFEVYINNKVQFHITKKIRRVWWDPASNQTRFGHVVDFPRSGCPTMVCSFGSVASCKGPYLEAVSVLLMDDGDDVDESYSIMIVPNHCQWEFKSSCWIQASLVTSTWDETYLIYHKHDLDIKYYIFIWYSM